MRIVRKCRKRLRGKCLRRVVLFGILVQSVLDRYCLACHNAEKSNGMILAGKLDGHYTKSYNPVGKRPFLFRVDSSERKLRAAHTTAITQILRKERIPLSGAVALQCERAPDEKEYLHLWMTQTPCFTVLSVLPISCVSKAASVSKDRDAQ